MIHGVINIRKEKGFTSHDVVAKLRGILGQRKIGHTGTLDPDAEGVLPVCLGKATKLCDMLTDHDKVYETVLLLGLTTDTQDITGAVLEERDTGSIPEADVRSEIQQFVGDFEQVPPMYSAVKVNGRKLYELAREGKVIERKARPVHIYDIQISRVEGPRVFMTVHCSKGTYIRTLCHDIGSRLGVGGCMETLVRTKVSRFTLEESITLSEVERRKAEGTISDYIVPIDEMFRDYRSVHVKETASYLIYNGNPFPGAEAVDSTGIQAMETVRVYDHKNRFTGIYRYDQETAYFKIVKMFFDKDEMAYGE